MLFAYLANSPDFLRTPVIHANSGPAGRARPDETAQVGSTLGILSDPNSTVGFWDKIF